MTIFPPLALVFSTSRAFAIPCSSRPKPCPSLYPIRAMILAATELTSNADEDDADVDGVEVMDDDEGAEDFTMPVPSRSADGGAMVAPPLGLAALLAASYSSSSSSSSA